MKSIVVYLLFVGIPILMVIGVLQLGSNLKPPISVGGVWNVEVPAQTANLCGITAFHSDQPALTISQSGSNLQLTFNDEAKTSLPGVLEDTNGTSGDRSLATITARVSNSQELTLRATVDRASTPNRLRAELSAAGCPSGAVVSFTATRQPRSGG